MDSTVQLTFTASLAASTSMTTSAAYLEQMQNDFLTGGSSQQLTQGIQHNFPSGLAHAHSTLPVHFLLATHCTVCTQLGTAEKSRSVHDLES